MTSSWVQADDVWVGKEVIPKRGKPNIRQPANGQVVGIIDYFPATVRAENGMLIQVQVRDKRGWIAKEEVVRVEDAVQYFTGRIQNNDGLVEAYRKRASVYAMKGESDRAIKDADEAIRLEPSATRAYNTRGIAWFDKKEYDKAIQDYSEAIRLDPKNVKALSNRGNAWREKKEYDKAIQDYSEAIRIDPRYIIAIYNRGNVWSDKKEYDKAIQDYSEVIQRNPTDVGALDARGLAWFRKQECDKAIEDFEKAIQHDPKYANAFLGQGIAWHWKKVYDKALKNYDEAIKLDPKDVFAWNNKVFLLATCADDKIRNVDKAEELMKTVVALRPTSPYNEEMFSVIAAARGRFDEAIKHQNKALEDKEYTEIQGERARERLKLYAEKKPYRF